MEERFSVYNYRTFEEISSCIFTEILELLKEKRILEDVIQNCRTLIK